MTVWILIYAAIGLYFAGATIPRSGRTWRHFKTAAIIGLFWPVAFIVVLLYVVAGSEEK